MAFLYVEAASCVPRLPSAKWRVHCCRVLVFVLKIILSHWITLSIWTIYWLMHMQITVFWRSVKEWISIEVVILLISTIISEVVCTVVWVKSCKSLLQCPFRLHQIFSSQSSNLERLFYPKQIEWLGLLTWSAILAESLCQLHKTSSEWFWMKWKGIWTN